MKDKVSGSSGSFLCSTCQRRVSHSLHMSKKGFSFNQLPRPGQTWVEHSLK